MHIANIITQLREERQLSQEDLAGRLFVTRQAVSKWERGKAMPDPDTMLRISKEFGISISMLMGAPEQRLCQSCGMPLDNPADISPTGQHFCKWCYVDGDYAHPSTLDEMVEEIMTHAHWEDPAQGRRFLRAQLAELERWQS